MAKKGQPLKFKTVELLDKAISKYFDDISKNNKLYLKHKGEKKNQYEEQIPTMSGLAVALGVDRKTLVNYGNKDAYFHTIKKARSLIEEVMEQRLMKGKGSTIGHIFALKNNYDWHDKQEQDLTSKGKGIGGVVLLPTKKKLQDVIDTQETPAKP